MEFFLHLKYAVICGRQHKNERKEGLLHSCKEWMKISLFWLCGLSMSFAELVGYTKDWITFVEFEKLDYLFIL